ncbi:MAG: RNA 2',3'-cyclic phosphodiesterase [Candidatus Omnitrophica bacterium]|jgi:2'-5' RNA ligase|nr:RNA 2',3'-cyclic phosphodiesterase [Candidatus Omnitrophota bacterium]
MRLFIAIDIPEDLKEKLSRAVTRLKKCDLDAKWVNTSNIHMTLKFLGEVSEEQLDKIKNIIKTTAGNFSQLELNVGSFGFFPNETSPRVFFISTDNEEILKNISLQLEDKLESLGFPKEGRFKSHLTIARFRTKRNIDCLKNEMKGMTIEAKFAVSEIILFKSLLKPTGPVYEKLFCAPLQG